MINTTELRKRFRDKMHEAHFRESAGLYRTLDVNSVEDWVVSEIEAVEKAKVEEAKDLIEWAEGVMNGPAFSEESGLIWEHWLVEGRRILADLSLTKHDE